MKRYIVAVVLIAAVGCDVNSTENREKENGVIFNKFFGQTNSAEWMTSLSHTSDGGYIISGSTGGIGFGQENALLMKIDRNGNYLWQRSFGVEGENEFSRKVIEVDDGYLFIGNTMTMGAGNSDMYLVKTDINGNLIWDRTYGSTAGEDGFDILKVHNGYMLLGNKKNTNTSESDFFVVRTDLDGNQLWAKNYGTDSDDIAHRMIILSDGSIILGGYTFGNADYIDIYLIKISSSGDKIWERNFDGPQTSGSSGDVLGNMKPTPDGGFIIAGTQGYIFGTGFSGLAWILKLTSDGNLTWNKTFGTVNNRDDAQGGGILVLEDGYLLAGTKLTPDEQTDYYLVRTDLSGNVLWEKTVDHSTSDKGVDIVARDNVFTFGGIGYESENWYQVYLLSFKNRPDL